jgi:hypothetical protein
LNTGHRFGEFNLSQANRLNICIIPGGRGRVLNLHFRRVTLAIVASLAFISLLALGGYAFHSYRMTRHYVDSSWELETLRAIHAGRESQTESFSSTLSALEEKLRRLD